MSFDRIRRALEKASDTRSLIIESGALGQVGTVFKEAFGDKKAVVVADTITFEVAGRAVQARLAEREAAPPVIFPGQPVLYAEFENVLELENRLKELDAIPVAVGSGTINDLTKLASHRLRRPYMVVATAASMDGYAAFGAAITSNGFKQTMACPAPRAILADLEVLSAAPDHMNARGYGDLLGKITAGADWLLADALEVEALEPFSWSLVQDSLREWTGQPAKLRAGESQAISNLFEGLVMSGLAMQSIKSSRPASGTEHHFSHLWEMEALGYGKTEYPHGYKVGIGTIAATAFYRQLLARDLTRLDIDNLCESWPSRQEVEQQVRNAHDIPRVVENAVAESLAKYITADQLRQRLTLLVERWPELREKLAAQLLTPEEVQELLRQAGCPARPSEIGVDLRRLHQSYFKARQIRSRYTVLELAYETGQLEECAAELFAPEGFWQKNS
ncbi:MAG TPA: sn-glycerol-1-phosphate dehydrogenase [Chloroflexia bacterium]|nr:sn-glycerol-1-phosphate dehydrogenase [Chloroflexia bacterium]